MLNKWLFKNPDNWLKWFLIALVAKGTFFAVMLKMGFSTDIAGFWGATNGDWFSYVSPIENVLAGGTYNIDNRIPGYGACYFVLRLLFDKAAACNVLIFTQLLVAVISVTYLAKIARIWFKSDLAFCITFYSYLFSSLTNVFDHYLLAESFAASSVIFWVYFLTKFEQTRQKQYLVISGAFMTFLIFLKPVHALMLGLGPLIWFVYFLQKKLVFKQVIQYSLLFVLPFAVIDGAWIIRNYYYYKGAFVPIMKTVWYADGWPPNYFEMRDFTEAWGGDINFGLPHSDARWIMGFENDQYLNHWFVHEQMQPVPIYAHTSRFNGDSLLWIRQESQRTLYGSMSSVERTRRQQIVKQKLIAYTASIRSEKPFLYYVRAPLRIAYRFLIGVSGSHFLEDVVANRRVHTILFWYHLLLLGVGSLGLLLLFLSEIRNFGLPSVAWLGSVYVVVVLCVFLRHAETRYLVPAWPFWAIGAGFLVDKLYKIVFEAPSSKTHFNSKSFL